VHRTEFCNILAQLKLQGDSASVCLSPTSFASLCTVLGCLLDGCLSDKDYDNAKAVLEAGNIFFTEQTHGQRRYVESELQSHKLWKNLDYWKASLSLAIRERYADTSKPSLVGPVYQEFVLEWLLASCHKMLSFKLPAKNVGKALDEMARRYALDPSRQTTLRQFYNRVVETSKQWQMHLGSKTMRQITTWKKRSMMTMMWMKRLC